MNKINLILVFTVATVLSFSCAGTNKNLRKSKKNTTENNSVKTGEPEIQVPEKAINEIEEKLVPYNEKKSDPHQYFVITGSFRNYENAKKFQIEILNNGFTSEILKNESGLYRVSVMSTDEIDAAREMIRKIRRAFYEYSDTWLLIQKK